MCRKDIPANSVAKWVHILMQGELSGTDCCLIAVGVRGAGVVLVVVVIVFTEGTVGGGSSVGSS